MNYVFRDILFIMILLCTFIIFPPLQYQIIYITVLGFIFGVHLATIYYILKMDFKTIENSSEFLGILELQDKTSKQYLILKNILGFGLFSYISFISGAFLISILIIIFIISNLTMEYVILYKEKMLFKRNKGD